MNGSDFPEVDESEPDHEPFFYKRAKNMMLACGDWYISNIIWVIILKQAQNIVKLCVDNTSFLKIDASSALCKPSVSWWHDADLSN